MTQRNPEPGGQPRGSLTLDEHRVLGGELAVLNHRLTDRAVQLSRRYGANSKPSRRAHSLLHALNDLRSQLDDQLLRDHSDHFEPQIYYPGTGHLDGHRGPHSGSVLQAFNKLCPGLTAVALEQLDRDPDTARFVLVLIDGHRVPLGSGRDLLDQARTRTAIAVNTGLILRQSTVHAWDHAVKALLTVRTFVDEETAP